MKPIISTGEEQGLFPWSGSRYLEFFLNWLLLSAGTSLQLVIQLHWLWENLSNFFFFLYAGTKKSTSRDTCSHSHAHIHVHELIHCTHTHTHTHTHIRLLLTCTWAAKPAFRFNEPQLLNSNHALDLSGKNWKWARFKSLFRIYQVKIVIRPPTCAQTYNPQLHCRFLPKNNSAPPSLPKASWCSLHFQAHLANKRSSGCNKTQTLFNLRFAH